MDPRVWPEDDGKVSWIPAFARMTNPPVIPAKAGIHIHKILLLFLVTFSKVTKIVIFAKAALLRGVL